MMHFHEALLSVLMRRGDFRRRFAAAMEDGDSNLVRLPTADNLAGQAFEAIRKLLSEFEPYCQDMVGEALAALRRRAGERGLRIMEDGLELRASVDQVRMDWGKTGLHGDKLTLRLISTHIGMPADPVVVEREVLVG